MASSSLHPFLPQDFSPSDLASVRSAMNHLKAAAPHNPKSAKDWYDCFCALSDRITDHQTALEIKSACHLGDPATEHELEIFDRDIIGLVLSQRASLIRIYLESPWQKAMHADDGGRLRAELMRRQRTSDARLTELQLQENSLIRQYRSFVHSAQTRFLDTDTPLSVVVGKMNDRSESLRRLAYLSFWRFVEAHRSDYKRFFCDLAKLRQQQANLAGYRDYESFVYDDMGRDFTPDDARRLRKSIAKHIVPVVSRFSNRQAAKLEFNPRQKIHPWNARIWQDVFPEAPPCGGDQDALTNAFQAAATQLHHVAGQCLEALLATKGFDVFPRHRKAPGAFCALRPKLGIPFVFGNFSVSARDLFSMFHEFGHAVHGYCSAPIENTLLRSPGLEYCEFVSTTFEFLAHETLDLFWSEKGHAQQAAKFHLFHSLAFIPFAAQIDEWQARIYQNPEETDELWSELTDTYRPHLDWHTDAPSKSVDVRQTRDPLDAAATKGLGWCSRPHVFTTPFYYIDYAIAQMGAWQIYAQVQTGGAERMATLQKLVDTLFLGGQRSTLQLFEAAGCRSPFEDATVAKVASIIEATLNGSKV
jgi:oligoendopeptidase F